MRSIVVLTIFWLLALVTPSIGAATPPTVTGPITGGTQGRPFTAALVDLAKFGYVEEEYFIAGMAARYGVKPGGVLAADGRWDVVAEDREPYKTRFLVRRPSDRKRFNGTVVVEWMQSSAGFDKDVNWNWQKAEFLRDGYVWIGVSAQREGVDGSPPKPGSPFVDLVRWDPERYGSLHIPSESLSYDIYAQVAKAVASPQARTGVDPLDGLAVKKVLAIGDTFAADHLVVVYDALQPIAHPFDGYFIGWRHIPGAAPLADSVPMPAVVKLRTDLDAPVFVVNTGAEALPHYPARQPDGRTYRLWEIAGSAHTNAYWIAQMYAINKRDFGMPIPHCDRPFNTVPNQYVMNAAIHALARWAKGGPSPPSAPPIAISGTPPAVQRDRFGNSAGGVRLPEVEVPIARYEIGGDRSCPGGSGFTDPLPADELEKLYPTHEVYEEKYAAAAKRAEQAGFLLPADAVEGIATAHSAHIPR
ncbi:MAG TPA: alpha/beta hydrolase domain-containing protein [Alphaproteobacteria bacterium]|nr:alpha/beta hydrolase domain-containing protein [Alphaproteobacteria bacterium]